MGSESYILTHSLERVAINCTLCGHRIELTRPETLEENLLLEGDCEGCGAHVMVFDTEELCPKCFGLAMHGPSQLVLDI